MLNCRVEECDLSDNATSASQNDDGLRDKKLKLAGYSYLLGDAAMYAAAATRSAQEGIKKQGGNKIGAASWFVGGLAAARYGNPDDETRLGIQASKLEQHLKQQGVTIPDSVREQNALLKSPTLWQKAEHFLYQHPSEILNFAYAVGAATILKGALGQKGKDLLPKKFGKGALANINTDFWIGSLVLGGALGGLLIKEDKQAKDRPENQSGFGKVKAFFQEKPLRWSGTLYTVNNGFLGLKAWQDIKLAGQHGAFKPHYFSSLQLATYLFSNTMLMMSSRDQMQDRRWNPQHIAQLEDASARIIAAQPGEVQQALIGDISHYLAEQKGLGQDASHIAQALATRLTQITGERAQQAANSVSWVEREQARLSQAITPAVGA